MRWMNDRIVIMHALLEGFTTELVRAGRRGVAFLVCAAVFLIVLILADAFHAQLSHQLGGPAAASHLSSTAVDQTQP